MKENMFIHRMLRSWVVFLFVALLSGCGQDEIIQNTKTKGEFFEIFSKGNQEYIEAVAAEDVDGVTVVVIGTGLKFQRPRGNRL